MDTLQTIANIISQVGFPVAMASAMVYLVMKENKQHKDESDKWIAALQENTDVVRSLRELVEEMKGK